MSDDKRRQALKALAIGAPAVWAKPVVDSVVLPAHAKGTVDAEEEPTCPDCFPYDGEGLGDADFASLVFSQENACEGYSRWTLRGWGNSACDSQPTSPPNFVYGPFDGEPPLRLRCGFRSQEVFELPCGTFAIYADLG